MGYQYKCYHRGHEFSYSSHSNTCPRCGRMASVVELPRCTFSLDANEVKVLLQTLRCGLVYMSNSTSPAYDYRKAADVAKKIEYQAEE